MIETQRLILRNWRPDDDTSLYRYASDRRVSELALWPRHESKEMSRYVIDNIFIPNQYSFAMAFKATDEAIGCIGLVPQGDEHYPVMRKEREVGYWIGYPFWNMGLTTEALNGLIEYCRGTLLLKSLLITTDARNVTSQRVAEKCGFGFIGYYTQADMDCKAYRLYL